MKAREHSPARARAAPRDFAARDLGLPSEFPADTSPDIRASHDANARPTSRHALLKTSEQSFLRTPLRRINATQDDAPTPSRQDVLAAVVTHGLGGHPGQAWAFVSSLRPPNSPRTGYAPEKQPRLGSNEPSNTPNTATRAESRSLRPVSMRHNGSIRTPPPGA